MIISVLLSIFDTSNCFVVYSYLLTNNNRVRTIIDVMPMIGARFFNQLDMAHLRSDVIEHELAKVMMKKLRQCC